MKIILNIISILLLSATLIPKSAYAVPPPDFIIQITSQLGNFFAIGLAFLLTVLAATYQFIKIHFIKYKKAYWAVGVVSVIVIAGISAYYLDISYQKSETEKANQVWLNESSKNAEAKGSSNSSDANEIKSLNVKPKIPTVEKAIADKGIKLIQDYYAFIAQNEFKKAYEISKKSTSIATFSSWYKNTTDVKIKDIVKIDDNRYSLELALYEGSKATFYGVLMELKLLDGIPIKIADSKVRILDKFTKKDEAPIVKIDSESKTDFWAKNKSSSIKINNKEFEAEIKNGSNYIVLDARENIEYENGYFPGSTHIRYADLQAGRWIEVPNDKFVYVICWSGIRGKEVAEYLRSKKITSAYLTGGANGWVKYGGKWVGNIKFVEVYKDDRYKKVFNTKTVREKVKNGAKLVDSRPPSDFLKKKIPGSINIPLMHTPTSNLKDTFAKLSPGGEVITICDDYVDCFDAKLTGVELERRGYTFLGRYNRPWEY